MEEERKTDAEPGGRVAEGGAEDASKGLEDKILQILSSQPNKRGIHANDVYDGLKSAYRQHIVTGVLWSLWGAGLADLNVRGKWTATDKGVRRVTMAIDLTPYEQSVLGVIRRSNPDLMMSELAKLTGVPRSQLRGVLDELVTKRYLIMKKDGWYQVVAS